MAYNRFIKLHEAFNIEKLDYHRFAHNPLAIHYFINFPHPDIPWARVFSTRTASLLLDEHEDKIQGPVCNAVCKNANLIDYCCEHPEIAQSCSLSVNLEVSKFIEEHLDNNYNHPDLCPRCMSENPSLISQAEDQLFPIDFDRLSCNPQARSLLLDNFAEINWSEVNQTPDLFDLLRDHPEFIDFTAISHQPAAIDLLEHNYHLLDIDRLSLNPQASIILQSIPSHLINWRSVGEYNTDLDFIRRNLHLIKQKPVCRNKNMLALIRSFKEPNWHNLSFNEAAIDILATNHQKVSYKQLSSNPAIWNEI